MITQLPLHIRIFVYGFSLCWKSGSNGCWLDIKANLPTSVFGVESILYSVVHDEEAMRCLVYPTPHVEGALHLFGVSLSSLVSNCRRYSYNCLPVVFHYPDCISSNQIVYLYRIAEHLALLN